MPHGYRFFCLVVLLSAGAAWGQTAPTSTLTATCAAPCNAPASITLSASTTVASGRTVSKVEFYDGTTLLATDTSAPYSSARANVTGGSHSFTAKVYDSGTPQLSVTSAAKVVAVNSAPTVTLATACGASPCVAPAIVTLTATPADIGGAISKVEFYRGATLIATKVAAPWIFTDSPLAAASYSYTAKAFDNAATPLSTVSTAQSILVDTAPTVTLSAACTAPCNAPAAITLTATTTVAPSRAVSKVEFYEGATLLATDTASPYSSARTAVTGGSHTYTARVYDNAATPLTATGSAALVAVNTAPTVTLAAVCSANPCNAPATVTLTATPADADGTISKVEFYRGTTPLTTKTAAPWTYADTTLAAGSYSYTAKAFDNATTPLSTTSAAQAITVVTPATPPTVTLTAVCTAPCNAPAAITLTATAIAASGRTVSKVEFYEGTTLLATDTTSPYSTARASVSGGTHSYTARVYDSASTPLTATSTVVAIAVNTAPTVSLIAACNASPCNAPAAVTLTATPADSDGTITKVEFYRGTTLINAKTAAPWSYTDSALVVGTHSYTAKAFDNGATSLAATSSAQSTVVSPASTMSVTLVASCSTTPCMAPSVVYLAVTPTVGVGRTVAKVEFYDGTQLLGEVTTPPPPNPDGGAELPWSKSFAFETAGTHSFTAKVYDNSSLALTVVSTPLTVRLTSMMLNVGCLQTCEIGATLTLTTSDIQTAGATISRIEFIDLFNDTQTPVGALNNAPWIMALSNAAWGYHRLVARMYDNSTPPVLIAQVSAEIRVGPAVTLAVNCVAPCIEPATVNFSVDGRAAHGGAIGFPPLIDSPLRATNVTIDAGATPRYAGVITGVRSGIHKYLARATETVSSSNVLVNEVSSQVTVIHPLTQMVALNPTGVSTALSVPSGADMIFAISAQAGDHLTLLLENQLADDGATQVSYSLLGESCSAVAPKLPNGIGDIASHANLLAYGPLQYAYCNAPSSEQFNIPSRQILNLSAFGPTSLNVRLSRTSAPAMQSFKATLMRQEQLALLPNGSPVTVAPELAARAQRYEFAAASMQIVSLTQAQSGPIGYEMRARIASPAQPDDFIDGQWVDNNDGTAQLIQRRPEAGNFTLVATQQTPIRGTTILTYNTPLALGMLQTDGTPIRWQPARRGSIASMTFNAVAGRTYHLLAARVTSTIREFRYFVDDPSGNRSASPTGSIFEGYGSEYTATQTGVHTITYVSMKSVSAPFDFSIIYLDALPTIQWSNPSAIPACPGGPYANELLITQSNFVYSVKIEQTPIGGDYPANYAPAPITTIIGAGPYSFTWANYQLGFTYKLVATAFLKDGSAVSTPPLTVTFTAPPAVINCALAGGNFSTDDDQLSFAGDVTGPKNASVFVNNVRVPLDEQGRFLANNIPLSVGVNTISVLVNQLSGFRTLTYNVNRNGAPAFSVVLANDTGREAFSTTFTVTNRNNLPWQRIAVERFDDGVELANATPAAGNTFSGLLSIPVKGRYKVRFRVYGANNAVLFETYRFVLVTRPSDDIVVVKEAYTGMTQHLVAGSVSAALNHFTDESLPKFRAVLNALAPSLPLFAGSASQVAINLGSCCNATVYPSTAELLVTRYKGGKFYGYRIYLIRDAADGLWRIHDM
jgi:hypothetical protein